MVNIKRGEVVLKVTQNAFSNIYAPQGWELVGEPSAEVLVQNDSNDLTPDETPNNGELSNDEVETDSEEEEKAEEPEVTPEREVEKPISEMSLIELQAYAKKHNILCTGCNSKAEYRKVIAEVTQA